MLFLSYFQHQMANSLSILHISLLCLTIIVMTAFKIVIMDYIYIMLIANEQQAMNRQ
jgi:cell division protein FtsL